MYKYVFEIIFIIYYSNKNYRNIKLKFSFNLLLTLGISKLSLYFSLSHSSFLYSGPEWSSIIQVYVISLLEYIIEILFYLIYKQIYKQSVYIIYI